MTEQQANLTANQEKFAQALYDAYKSGNPLLESEWEGVRFACCSVILDSSIFNCLTLADYNGYSVSVLV